jgi:hypothetical protein
VFCPRGGQKTQSNRCGTAAVVALALTDPVAAAIVAGTLLALGFALVIVLAGAIRRAIRARRQRRLRE